MKCCSWNLYWYYETRKKDVPIFKFWEQFQLIVFGVEIYLIEKLIALFVNLELGPFRRGTYIVNLHFGICYIKECLFHVKLQFTHIHNNKIQFRCLYEIPHWMKTRFCIICGLKIDYFNCLQGHFFSGVWVYIQYTSKICKWVP